MIDTLINIDEEQDYPWQAELLLYVYYFVISIILYIYLLYFSELVRCYMDANNIDKAREVSTQLLQLCQTKQLPHLSNILQFLVRFISEEKKVMFLFLKTVNNVIEPDNLLPYAPSSESSSLFNRLLIELASIHRLRFFFVHYKLSFFFLFC